MWAFVGSRAPTNSMLSGLGPAEDVLLLPAGSRSKASRSWTQRIASTWLPPAPRLPSGTSAASGASSRIGLAVPSMKPVRSRLSRWTKPVRSEATTKLGARVCVAARACSKTTSGVPPLIHSHRSCWDAGAWWPPSTPSGWNGARSSGASSGSIARHRSAPKPRTMLTPPAATAGIAQAFQDGADGRQVDVGPQLELEELVGDRALREDAELGQRHGRRLAHDERWRKTLAAWTDRSLCTLAGPR